MANAAKPSIGTAASEAITRSFTGHHRSCVGGLRSLRSQCTFGLNQILVLAVLPISIPIQVIYSWNPNKRKLWKVAAMAASARCQPRGTWVQVPRLDVTQGWPPDAREQDRPISTDGIGPEVISAGLEILAMVATRDDGFSLKAAQYDWGDTHQWPRRSKARCRKQASRYRTQSFSKRRQRWCFARMHRLPSREAP